MHFVKYLFQPILCFILLPSCVNPKNRLHHKNVVTAYFMNSTTVGLVVTHYIGGDGTPWSGDEHPTDFSLQLYLYDIPSGNLTEKQILATEEYYSSWSPVVADSILFINFSGSGTQFSWYSAKSGDKLGSTSPLAFYYPSLSAISPNGNYIYFQDYSNGGRGQVYDLVHDSYSPVITGSYGSIYRLENDGTHCISALDHIAPERIGSIFLARKLLGSDQTDTIMDITGYRHVYMSSREWIFFKNPRDTVGYIMLDTSSTPPEAQFISLNLTYEVIDLDTATGYYLTDSDIEGGAFLGNYKTGEPRKQIFLNE